LAAIQEMEKKERKTFAIDAVDKLFYNRFFGLLQSRNYQPNTVGKYIESLKTILHEAESKGVKVNVFLKDKKFIIPYADVSNEYLNEKEIKILQELDLTDKPRLERVRDVFMIGCKTGQRYQTYSKFTKDMFENDRIKIYQRKNSNQVIIPIDNYVTDIMEKYNWKLPCIASQKFNEYIKEVCQLAGFDQPISKTVQMGTIMKTIVEPKYEIITSHTARRSYATNMYLRDKGAMISIMKATGHKSVKMFLKYVLASDEEHLSIMRDIQNGVPKEPIRLKVANS
jgi:integrase